ncbi:hypothetical protein K461DRAFT_283140 [Myriangium duriaei CBS 260.36]|uniref:F-box domain-containing protein n=1 Tax=Myriangium duriaei CBS 260.36 TaxID=1168546 RepID=A0A9P4IWB5_9PEZI|nr:hypothetical protein K461DRAFT_283140 [Myriangium duriaei CBS 260.36]
MYLPEEILHNIAKNLEVDQLLKFSRASRTCHRLAQPALYAHLKPDYEHLYALLRTLTDQPEKAAFVRSIVLDHFYPFEYDMEESHGDKLPPTEELSKLFAAAESLSLTSQVVDRLRRGLQDNSTDAKLALLLCLCPGVESLSMPETAYFIQDSVVISVLGESGPLPVSGPSRDGPSTDRRFQSLTEVQINHADTEGSTHAFALESIIFLPAIKTLNGHMLDFLGRQRFSTPRYSSIREIKLTYSIIDSGGWEQLLIACPDLRSLSIEFGDAILGAECELSWASVGTSLRTHGLRLEKLSFESEMDNFFLEELDESMGSLSSLSLLQTLNLPYDSLFGRTGQMAHPQRLKDMVPKTLRSLCLQVDSDPELREQCEKQLREVRDDSRFQELQVVRYTVFEPGRGPVQVDMR